MQFTKRHTAIKPFFLLLGLLCLAPELSARPAYKKALADYFGPFLPNHLNDCRTCHLPDKAENQTEGSEKPHNAFGVRLVNVKKELKKAGKETDIVSRLRAIANEDSDGDGVPNFLELLAGRNPGEAADIATPPELVRAKRLLTAFLARVPYAWQPFEPVRQPTVPQVKTAGWGHNPIDAFLAQQHELFGLTARPRAPAEVLLRRVYLDLIGLPPTPEELDAFMRDPSPQAYEKVVDQLLARPQYGERWARHWMDIWRYVDGGTSGLQDGWVGAPNMWRWRDWIIDALNADKGYDRMVQEMLAGDELAGDDPKIVVATAYLVRNKNVSRDHWLHDTVNHAARGFLAVTMECCRCHDHMYDPLLQTEYYQMRAIFETVGTRTDPAPDAKPMPDKKGRENRDKNGLTRVVDEGIKPTYLFIRGVEQNPDKSKVMLPGVPKMLGQDGFEVEPVKTAGKTSSGRRLAFARWLTRTENPLTARVAMNHIWLRHFGEAIVPSTFNFGADGQPPSHPALLDWLAGEFMRQGWSMKIMHRLIVTSNAYQMSSTPDARNLDFDPENHFLWRMPLKRMEAEVVRDSILAVSGQLDGTMKGPDLDTKRAMEMKRRSIYFRYTDSDFLRFLEFFDPPPVEDCYRRVSSILPQQALTLLNSDLALVQSRILARSLAEQTKGDAHQFIQRAFVRVLSRPGSAAEERACVEFLDEQVRLFEQNKGKISGTGGTEPSRGSVEPRLRARENLVHLLFNHNDFVTIR